MARRIPISRRRVGGATRGAARGVPLFQRLDLRISALAGLAFLAITLLAGLGFPNKLPARLVAESWSNWFLSEGQTTKAGDWTPDAARAAQVDRELAAQSAAYLFADAKNKILSASERIHLEGAIWPELGPNERTVVEPLGRVAVLSVKVGGFAQPRGYFHILTRGAVDELRAPIGLREELKARLPSGVMGTSVSFGFLLFGVATTILLSYLIVYIFVSRRLRSMLSIARVPIAAARPPRRMHSDGGDELASLAQSLNHSHRRAHTSFAEMSRREKLRRDWLSELSHDLRTPLAALELRLENTRKLADDKARLAALTIAIEDLTRIQTLANGFVELAELEVTEDFHFEAVMPEELVGQVVRRLEPIAVSSEVDLRSEIADQPTIEADGQRLLRALENIVRNAIRHAKTEVVIHIEDWGNEVAFVVLDDGPGFASIERNEMTDHQDWLGRGQVRGLGLRVASRIARAHGGRLMIGHEDGQTVVACYVRVMRDDSRENAA